EHELLLQLRGTPVDRSVHQVAVRVLEVARTLHGALAHEGAETRRVPLQRGLDVVDELSDVRRLRPVRARSLTGTVRTGRWVYAHRLSVPAGDRVGSAVVICPTIMKGCRGTRPRATSVS